MNNITITGRLGRNPELKTAQNGTEYTNFVVAVDRRPEKDGTKKTDWFNCTSFNKQAAMICTYFKKGDGIEIRGRMQDDPFSPKDAPDKKVHSWSLMVEEVDFPKGSKKDEAKTDTPTVVAAQTVPAAPAASQTAIDLTQADPDDIPF